MSQISNENMNNFRNTLSHYIEIWSFENMRRHFETLRQNWIAWTVDDLTPFCPSCTRVATQALIPGLYQSCGCRVTWECRIGSLDDLVVEWPPDRPNESLTYMMSLELRKARGVSVSYPYLVIESEGGYRILYNLWDTGNVSTIGWERELSTFYRFMKQPERRMALHICAPRQGSKLSSEDRTHVRRVLTEVGRGMFAFSDDGESIADELVCIFGLDRLGQPKMEYYQAFMAGMYLLEDTLPFNEVTLFGSSAYYIFRAHVGDLILHPNRDAHMPKDLDISVVADDNVVDREKAFVDFVRMALHVMEYAIGHDWDLVRGQVDVCSPQPHLFRTQVVITNHNKGTLYFDLSMRFNLTGNVGEVPAPTPVVARQCVSWRYGKGVHGFKVLRPVLTMPISVVPSDCGEFLNECVPDEETFYMGLGAPMSCLYLRRSALLVGEAFEVPRDQRCLVRRIQDRHGPLRIMWDETMAMYRSSIIGQTRTAPESEALFVELEGPGRAILPTNSTYASLTRIEGWDDFKVTRVLKHSPRDGY